jgi:hypothetical protein
MDALCIDSCPPIWKKNQIGLSKNHKIIEKGKSESTNDSNKIKAFKVMKKTLKS